MLATTVTAFTTVDWETGDVKLRENHGLTDCCVGRPDLVVCICLVN